MTYNVFSGTLNPTHFSSLLHNMMLFEFHSDQIRWQCVCPFVCLSVPPSVSLSVTSRCFTEVAKSRITQTTPHDSQGL